MGLSGPKRRTKLSSDPNNNAWSKSTDGFGHKILSAQGWKPGDMLGAKDAAHAEHFTAANASHIKVMLREDNLGLGAKLGNNSAETFGLSTLSGIFGRLNGKSDAELEKQQSRQRDAELRAYQTHKYGFMNFVRGGLLVGDKMEDIPTLNADKPPAGTIEITVGPPAIGNGLAKSDRKKRKRLHEEEQGQEDEVDTAKGNALSLSMDESIKKGKKKHDTEVILSTLSDSKSRKKHKADAYLPADATEKQGKLRKKESMITATATDAGADHAFSTSDKETDKTARRAAKQARKEERAKRKEERKKRRLSRSVSPNTTTQDQEAKVAAAAPPTTGSVSFTGSRQAVRQRWIQQKRLASMDARSLNEILMLKTAVT